MFPRGNFALPRRRDIFRRSPIVCRGVYSLNSGPDGDGIGGVSEARGRKHGGDSVEEA
jgi:hypothetical protein